MPEGGAGEIALFYANTLPMVRNPLAPIRPSPNGTYGLMQMTVRSTRRGIRPFWNAIRGRGAPAEPLMPPREPPAE